MSYYSGTPHLMSDPHARLSSRTIESQESHYRSLLQQMAQGSETALTEFYRIFESKIYAFAKIRLNDSDETNDLLNDIMWEIWRGAGNFEGRSSVTTWVFGIAHAQGYRSPYVVPGNTQWNLLESTDLEKIRL